MQSRRATQFAQTSINGIKYLFLFYNQKTAMFECISRSFILTNYSEYTMGQFLSSNWFNYKFDITQDATFAVVGVPNEMNITEVASIVNQKEYGKLEFFTQFTILSSILIEKYNLLNYQSCSSVKIVSNDSTNSPKTILGLAVRSFKNIDDTEDFETRYVLLSHPSFECDFTNICIESS